MRNAKRDSVREATRPGLGASAPVVAIETMDRELGRLAQSAGALRLSLGAGLEALACKGGHYEMGFPSLEAYALERCERSGRWVQESRAAARRLETLPRLGAALLTGRIGWSMALLVASIATPEDEHEWLELAGRRTVRQMKNVIRERRPDVPGAEDAEAEANLSIVATVADAWLFECASLILRHMEGWLSHDQVIDFLLGEGESSLCAEVPPDALCSMMDEDPWRSAEVAWARERRRMRDESEARCEANFFRAAAVQGGEARGGAEGSGAELGSVPSDADATQEPATPALATLRQWSISELDAHVRGLAAELLSRDVVMGNVLDQFWRAEGWLRLGYASGEQYARERLGMSYSSVKARRALVARMALLPQVAEALRAGRLGHEAASLVSRVASRETASVWIARARERTVKHLREEVMAAELSARLSGNPAPEPPPEESIKEVLRIEAAIVSGRVFDQTDHGARKGQTSAHRHEDGVACAEGDEQQTGQPSAHRHEDGVACAGGDELKAGQMSAHKALTALLAALDRTRRPLAEGPLARRRLGQVTLRFRVRASTLRLYRAMERVYRRHVSGKSFLRFLCWTLIDTWRGALGREVAYEPIYARDGYRCQNPVCPYRHVTPHHILYRSLGGGDSAENIISLCVWCHLHGIHEGRLSAVGPASKIRWAIGREPHTIVEGRTRLRADDSTFP